MALPPWSLHLLGHLDIIGLVGRVGRAAGLGWFELWYQRDQLDRQHEEDKSGQDDTKRRKTKNTNVAMS